MKRLLVTGASRGLGLAVCRRMLQEGWWVMGTARRRPRGFAELESAFAGRFEFLPADLACDRAVCDLSRRANLLGGLDGFVANAAMGLDGLLTLTSQSAIRECVEVNLVAPMLLAREVVKGMLCRGGALVFIASAVAWKGTKGLTVYGATKGGLVWFSRALAREYGARRIRSNCVLPGFLKTQMTRGFSPQQRQRIRQGTSLKRLGQVDEVVGAVRFLLSDEARFITGTEIVVAGGS